VIRPAFRPPKSPGSTPFCTIIDRANVAGKDTPPRISGHPVTQPKSDLPFAPRSVTTHIMIARPTLLPTIATLLLAALPAFAPPAQAQEPTLNALTVTESIITLQNDPLSPEGVAAAGLILAYSEVAEEIEVDIFRPALPWLGTDPDGFPPYTEVLLAAYLAGDIQAQLAAGQKGAQVLPAVRMLLKVYQKIRAEDSDFQLPVMETMLDAERKGTLAQLIESARKPPQGQ